MRRMSIKKPGLMTRFLCLYLFKYSKLKIGVINIDWFKKSKNCKMLIQEKITMQNFDFLIVNENILNFQFDRNDIDVLYQDFLQIADSKKVVEDADLTAMANSHQQKILATA